MISFWATLLALEICIAESTNQNLPPGATGLISVSGIGLVEGEQVHVRADLGNMKSYNVFYRGYEEYNTVMTVVNNVARQDKRIRDIAERADAFPVDEAKSVAEVATLAAGDLGQPQHRFIAAFWYETGNEMDLRLVYQMSLWGSGQEMQGMTVMADSVTGEVYNKWPSIVSGAE